MFHYNSGPRFISSKSHHNKKNICIEVWQYPVEQVANDMGYLNYIWTAHLLEANPELGIMCIILSL